MHIFHHSFIATSTKVLCPVFERSEAWVPASRKTMGRGSGKAGDFTSKVHNSPSTHVFNHTVPVQRLVLLFPEREVLPLCQSGGETSPDLTKDLGSDSFLNRCPCNPSIQSLLLCPTIKCVWSYEVLHGGKLDCF